MFVLVTDTSANLNQIQIDRYQIEVIPLTYCIGQQEYYCPKNGEYDAHAFYDVLRAKGEVSTSQIPPSRYTEVFRPILQAGKDILFIGISSGVSGSYQSAAIAAEQLREDYPERKLLLVDSFGSSYGEGLLVLHAAECREKGMSVEETHSVIEKRKMMVYQAVTVGDLFFLKRTGRVSTAKAAIGTVLHIAPLLKGDSTGHLVVTGKVRGRKKALQAIAEKYFALAVQPETQTIAISHADCADDAETLKQMIMEKMPPKELIITCLEPVSGAHVGPDMISLFFVGDEQVRMN